MQVKIEKKFEVNEPIERVWELLSDPTRVVSSVPGAKITEKVDDKTYKGAISVKVGPTVTDYKGEVHILSLDPIAHRMEIEGKGQDVRGKGSASMKMTGKVRSLQEGSSEIITVSEVNVVGLLAQLGARMINEVSSKMFEQFTVNLQRQLEKERLVESGSAPSQPEESNAEAQPIKALPLVASALGEGIARSVKQILRGPKEH